MDTSVVLVVKLQTASIFHFRAGRSVTGADTKQLAGQLSKSGFNSLTMSGKLNALQSRSQPVCHPHSTFYCTAIAITREVELGCNRDSNAARNDRI
jgi:hypothetical protein